MNSETYISTATTTQVYTGPCKLVRVIVGETAAGAITIEDDNASVTGPTVAVLKASIAEGVYDFDVAMSNGIKVTTAGASKITVVYG